MPAAIHSQLLEGPTRPDWLPRRDHAGRPCSDRHNDLLPWADPYIAVLMNRLDERIVSNDEPWSPPADYDWQDDAFRPDQPASARLSWDAPVYGGWPLLDDL